MSTKTIGIGELGVVNEPGEVLKTLALGSCVAVIILDPASRTVGMAHVALPDSEVQPDRARKLPGYFADSAIPVLLEAMQKAGGNTDLRRLVVKLAGGASVMDQNNTFNIGKRNLLAVKKLLWQKRMGAVAEAVGGKISRTVNIYVDTGKVEITTPGREPQYI